MGWDWNLFEPIINMFRNGTTEPLPDIVETLPIINGRVTLTEIPDKFSKVNVQGNSITWSESTSSILTENKYRVDYSNRIVYFHQSREGLTLSFSYKGRGKTCFPASSIYTKQENGVLVTQTLQNIVDAEEDAINAITTLNNIVAGVDTAIENANIATANAVLAANDVSTAISNTVSATNDAITATTNAETATDNAITATTNANTATSTANTKITEMTNKISEATTAISNVNTAKDNAITATTNANTSANNAQHLVDTYKNMHAYNSATSYVVNNIVTYQGSSYICIQDCQNIIPTNTSYWDIQAQKGIDGTGTVTSVTSTNGDIVVGGTAENPTLTLNSGDTANKIIKLDSDGKKSADLLKDGTDNKVFTSTDRTKLDGIATGANNYTHPSTHSPSIIVQDSNNRFVTDAEKSIWNAKASTAVATTTTNGLMSYPDKLKLDNLGSGTVPMCKVFHDADQSVATFGTQVLAFNTELFDTDNIHDNVTNNTRLTCKTAGKYTITANIDFNALSDGTYGLFIKLNGTTDIARSQAESTINNHISLSAITLWDMQVNDYVEVYAYNSSSSSRYVSSLNTYSPIFSMKWEG